MELAQFCSTVIWHLFNHNVIIVFSGNVVYLPAELQSFLQSKTSCCYTWCSLFFLSSVFSPWMCGEPLFCWTDPFCFCACCFCCVSVCLMSCLLARMLAPFLTWSWTCSLWPSDHASPHLKFRFPGVLSLDIFLTRSWEEQCLKCLGCWDRWMYSWKDTLRAGTERINLQFSLLHWAPRRVQLASNSPLFALQKNVFQL